MEERGAGSAAVEERGDGIRCGGRRRGGGAGIGQGEEEEHGEATGSGGGERRPR